MTGMPVRLWLARAAIGMVFLVNIECALAFLWAPQGFAPGFELQGAAGSAAVRGMGILFLMWNVPYLVAAWHPNRHRLSLYEALSMQTIGVIGESLLLWSLNGGHPALQLSITRFISFDAGGLLLLCLAAWITRETH
jgi:hypothetical protein